MALTHKPSSPIPGKTAANEFPEELFPPLPSTVKERFPELTDWERVAKENYRKLVDVLLRRQREG